MCEIAVVDPERVSIQQSHQLAGTFYEEQEDAVGVLAVLDDGDEFSYDTYKSTNPHWQTLHEFLDRYYDHEDIYRLVIHGRNGTSGEQNRASAHPIEINCPQCDVDWIIHNGSVRGDDPKRGGHTSQGHDYTTKVDSEVIAHTVKAIPDSTENLKHSTYNVKGNLNYLVFAKEGILVHVRSKYHLSDDFRMTCRPEDFRQSEAFSYGSDNRWAIVRPGGEVDVKERPARKYRRSGNSRSASSATSGTSGAYTYDKGGNKQKKRPRTKAKETAGNTRTIRYKDHLQRFDKISCIKVAPGVLKLEDDHNDEHSYIYRTRSPKLYYFYAPEEAPDDEVLQQMVRVADMVGEHPVEKVRRVGVTATFEEFGQAQKEAHEIEKAAEETAQQTIMDIIDEEVPDVEEAAEQGALAALFEEEAGAA